MNKRKKKILHSVISCALMLGTTTVAAAEQEFSFDDYVVTADRIPMKQSETAASVTVITREQIEKSGNNRILDILKMANLSVFDSGSAGYSQSAVFINGDDRVLVLVDGRKINKENDLGGGHAKLNLNFLPSVKSIERIEIVRGPNSTLYGSDAAGGVINIITRKATKNETSFQAEGGSWGMRNYTVTAGGRENGLGYFITAEKKKQDYFEYKDAKTGEVKRMPNSAVDQDAISMRLDKDLNDGRSLDFYWKHVDSKTGWFTSAPGFKAPNGLSYFFPTAYEDNREDSVDLTYHWKNGTGADGSLKAYYSNDRREVHHYMEGWPSALDMWPAESRTTGVDWQENWKIAKNYNLVGGVSWRQVNVDIPKSGIRDYDIENKAIFLENRWQLPADWTLSAGIRHDDYNKYSDQNTGSVTINRKISNNTNIFASWGQVFRTPTVDQLYSAAMNGNRNLRPEKGDTVTVGINTILAKNTKLQASIFSSHLDDAIIRDTHTSPYTFKNVSNQKIKGLNIDLARQLSSAWNVSAGYSYAQIRLKDQTTDYSDDATNNQPNGYRLNVAYNQDKWDAGLTLRGVTGRSMKAFTSNSAWILDLSANYKINTNLTAYLKGYNLTDKAYEDRGVLGAQGEFPMAARHFYIGLEQRM